MPAIAPVYFDSALVAKFYLNEAGRDAVRDLARTASIVVTSGIAVAEVSAAFHRKFREGALELDVFEALHGQFQHDLENGLWRLIAPTEALLDDVRSLFAKPRQVDLPALDRCPPSRHGEGGTFRAPLLERSPSPRRMRFRTSRGREPDNALRVIEGTALSARTKKPPAVRPGTLVHAAA